MAMEAAPRPRPRLAAAVALLLFLAMTPPASAVVVPPLVARLRAFSVSLDEAGGGGFAECWDSLTRLGSCTSEILLFFVNGESYIGPECCVAVRGATRHCWPAMLASVGFTAEEADVLRGFCDAEEAAAKDKGPPPPPAGPVPAPEKP
ncbi:hypothetical protein PAHAL_3G041500 [Panicum hallii]|uniref:Prolamin-like domain-containing protein n=1 Tax=Panicum hallii TaxID=206008 RepID=A0A2S3H657_9POAL|nr:egg cell-secreted protein 1.2-like [Panicum hallii]PAN16166.1 hypothetical protein PAHAL_3G041500 [Panicum hallii]